MIVCLGILWSLLALIFGTAVVAVQEVSRTQLIAELKRVDREDRLGQFDRHAHEYGLTAMIYRQFSIVLFVITISLTMPPTDPGLLQPLYVLGISAGWFLLFGVAIPTAWARHAGESYLVHVLGFLEVMRRVTRPALAVVHVIDEIVRRLAGAPRGSGDPAMEMEQGILDAMSQAETTGVADQTEHAMIRSVMVLDDTSVAEIMTPRTDMIGIESTATYEEARETVATKGHSRIPVYEETLDRIVGILHARDLLRIKNPASFSLREMMRPVAYVPETKHLASLLREFQSTRIHMAIVLDEYGGTAGLVTFEDLLEELVGEIADEHEKPSAPPIRRLDARTAELDAWVRVDEVNEELEIHLPEDESYDTIGGYVFSKLGRIPTKGETLTADGVKLVILEAEPRCINRVRIEVIEGIPTA